MMRRMIVYCVIMVCMLSRVFEFKKRGEYKEDEGGEFILGKGGSF